MKRLALVASALVLLTGASARLTERQRALHVLDRLAFGARPGDVDKIMSQGIDAWIAQQLDPDRLPDRAVEERLSTFPTLQMSNLDLMQEYYEPIVQARRDRKSEGDSQELREANQRGRVVLQELVAQRIVRAVDSDRQLNEVMVDFWFNHFNVFAGKGADRFLLTSYERDTLRPRIWGRFEDLLMATAKSPAMLFYLDNARSRSGGLNENYAREIMELHTLGVDGGYTQNDVTELARVFTGWTIDRRSGAFVFRPRMHDSGAKTVLGVHFPAGGGMEEGEQMIRILAHHSATAHHIALQLCQRLVADEPPKALVGRVAAKFLASGGDLRQTVKAVIESPEFWDPRYYLAKMKSPFEFVISALRAVCATVDNPLPVARALQQIGEPLYGAPPPTGYSDKAEAWMNSGALINRVNFAVALTSNNLPGLRVRVEDPEKAALELGGPEFQRQ